MFIAPLFNSHTSSRHSVRPLSSFIRSRCQSLLGFPHRRLQSSVSEHSIRRSNRSKIPTIHCSANDLHGRKTVITTPLFYVNAPPHIGSAYPTIAADALARFYRMVGANPIFVTGCDEHGEKIAAAAASSLASKECAESDIQKFCDSNASQFDALWNLLDIDYDHFVRTTSAHHARVVTQFMQRVWDSGDIYKSVYEGLYCSACEEYKDEKDLLENNVCPTHLKSCSHRNEENYFFALSKYQTQLEEFLEREVDFVSPRERRNEVLGWVKSGLRDFSVSRANNPWGIPVPRDGSQTIYVWFDALVGYISPLFDNTDSEEPNLDKAVEKGWPADVHIIGKDILRFHAVYWPAMLMSAGLPLPRRVIGHGFITKDGMKMGKSLGNTVDPQDLVSTYGTDAVRYYFLKAVDFGRDGDFSEQRFVDVVNADLANSLGNLLSRSVNLLKKYCDGVLPVSSDELATVDQNEEEGKIRQLAERAAWEALELYQRMDFMGACESIMSISYACNTYIDRVAPWSKFKSHSEVDVAEAQRCITNVMEACRIVASGLSPVTPTLSRKIMRVLGMEQLIGNGWVWKDVMRWGILKAGMSFEKPKPVFPRLEIKTKAAASK